MRHKAWVLVPLCASHRRAARDNHAPLPAALTLTLLGRPDADPGHVTRPEALGHDVASMPCSRTHDITCNAEA